VSYPRIGKKGTKSPILLKTVPRKTLSTVKPKGDRGASGDRGSVRNPVHTRLNRLTFGFGSGEQMRGKPGTFGVVNKSTVKAKMSRTSYEQATDSQGQGTGVREKKGC